MTHSDQIVQAAQERFNEHMADALSIMENPIPPDLRVGEEYLQRWWLAKITDQHDYERLGPLGPLTTPTHEYNLYLHRVTGSDDDRAYHDHPWPNVSLILQGRYIEHTPVGDFWREPGDTVYRNAEDLHWLELVGDEPVWSMFLTGRKIRDWGFRCDDGRWIYWKDFCGFSPDDPDWWKRKGPGCGET